MNTQTNDYLKKYFAYKHQLASDNKISVKSSPNFSSIMVPRSFINDIDNKLSSCNGMGYFAYMKLLCHAKSYKKGRDVSKKTPSCCMSCSWSTYTIKELMAFLKISSFDKLVFILNNLVVTNLISIQDDNVSDVQLKQNKIRKELKVQKAIIEDIHSDTTAVSKAMGEIRKLNDEIKLLKNKQKCAESEADFISHVFTSSLSDVMLLVKNGMNREYMFVPNMAAPTKNYANYVENFSPIAKTFLILNKARILNKKISIYFLGYGISDENNSRAKIRAEHAAIKNNSGYVYVNKYQFECIRASMLQHYNLAIKRFPYTWKSKPHFSDADIAVELWMHTVFYDKNKGTNIYDTVPMVSISPVSNTDYFNILKVCKTSAWYYYCSFRDIQTTVSYSSMSELWFCSKARLSNLFSRLSNENLFSTYAVKNVGTVIVNCAYLDFVSNLRIDFEKRKNPDSYQSRFLNYALVKMKNACISVFWRKIILCHFKNYNISVLKPVLLKKEAYIRKNEVLRSLFLDRFFSRLLPNFFLRRLFEPRLIN